ncbi:toll/interleukin-1 receptor domain-containing protein [Sinosporangium siamense]|uniref:TIR domain-containing protein n=1 Tax=Sinosporangium siamense TaxID=1367973 RepID=A0A919RFS4_9ACTN|nr:toll/interleukin-1 receptor domain-containing protein [Sinosporangium siamense]GII90984.1 hypothetical protein Ssi02_12150 [Sinosporangium siamense]
MHDVFINYRTGDGDKSATTIETNLRQRFGEGKVFRASSSIKPGEHYPTKLLEAVRHSSAVIAVIGPDWSDSPRLHDENDWVRRELAEAFAYGIHVIPVLDGRRTERLNAAALPLELRRLAELNSFPLDAADAWSHLRHIGDRLTELVPALKASDRHAAQSSDSVRNTMDEVSGDIVVQSRHITGDVGTVVKNNQGPVHAGNGDITSNNFSGDGATYIARDDKGAIRRRRGGWRGQEDGDR